MASNRQSGCRPGAVHWVGIILIALLSTAKAEQKPQISIVIDDLGHHLGRGLRVVHLPGPVVCAILPYATYKQKLSQHARSAGKEVLVHLPLEPDRQSETGDPGLLTTSMSRPDFLLQLAMNLNELPDAIGVNNHKGSLLTRDSERMVWLMDLLNRREIKLFLDSRTTADSVAAKTAKARGLATTSRDVFLDNIVSIAAINERFDALLRQARRQGSAVGIGHPYPETLAVLEARLPLNDDVGVELVSLTDLVKRQHPEAKWLLSSSR